MSSGLLTWGRANLCSPFNCHEAAIFLPQFSHMQSNNKTQKGKCPEIDDLLNMRKPFHEYCSGDFVFDTNAATKPPLVEIDASHP